MAVRAQMFTCPITLVWWPAWSLVFPCVHMLDYLVMNHCSPCSHVHMPDYLGSPHWVGGFEDPARCEPRLVQSAGCCFRLVIRTIAGVALVVCVMEQLCHM